MQLNKMLSAAKRWKNRGLSLLGIAVLTTSMPAMAQDQFNHAGYLNDLYSFLSSQDSDAHELALFFEDWGNVSNAQSICQELASGVAPADLYSQYMDEAVSFLRSAAPSQAELNRVAYSMGLYVGSTMNLGSAYYCPQYQQQVVQALSQL